MIDSIISDEILVTVSSSAGEIPIFEIRTIYSDSEQN